MTAGSVAAARVPLVLILATMLAPPALVVAAEIVGRRLLDLPQYATSTLELAWDDALRARTLRDLGSVPLLVGTYLPMLALLGAWLATGEQAALQPRVVVGDGGTAGGGSGHRPGPTSRAALPPSALGGQRPARRRGRPVIVVVDPGSHVPPFEQVRGQVAAMVAEGSLPPGQRLPTVRRLAGDLGLAVNTVARAYRELEQEGVVVTRGRHGTFVAVPGADRAQEGARGGPGLRAPGARAGDRPGRGRAARAGGARLSGGACRPGRAPGQRA